jgi:regulator of protease activity HflC (stomatin/prohibitin superfamily)
MSLDFLGAVTGLFVVVYDGQHALKFTLGRAGNIVGPGVHFKVPIIQKYEVEETKHTTLNLEPQTIQLKDDLVYEVDCKVMYRIVDLRKAIIEIDDLVTGLENRVVMAVQRVVQAQDRESVRDTAKMVEEIISQLSEVEEQWGVRILQFGFSNISPSPATLEITQLELLAEERLSLYGRFRGEGLEAEAAVALLTGAVIATGVASATLGLRGRLAEPAQAAAQAGEQLASPPEGAETDPLADDDEDSSEDL